MYPNVEIVSHLFKTRRRKSIQVQATQPVARSSLSFYRRSLSSLIAGLLLFAVGVNIWMANNPRNIISRQVWRKQPALLQTVNLVQKNTRDYPPSAVIPPPLLTNPTVAANSFFYIKDLKTSYKVCDVLELYIEARDGQKVTKATGGDVLWPFLRSTALKASGPADQLTDHGNGSYTARLTLTWAGLVEPVVPFIHSGEYDAAVREIIQRVPIRFVFDGKFTAKGITEYTPCQVTKVIPYISSKPGVHYNLSSVSETCDFSDAIAGTNWYCLKPKTLPCSSVKQIKCNVWAGEEFAKKIKTPEEVIAIKGGLEEGVFLSNTGSVKTVKVIPRDAGKMTDSCLSLPECTQGLPPKPPTLAAGYYYKDSWKSKVCRERTFHSPDTLKCLRGKNLYFYGDSTLRHWFEFLVKNLRPTMKKTRKASSVTTAIGPLHAVDVINNITLTFRHHEFPIRNRWNYRDVKFTVNEIDALPGGPDTVVLLSLWAHFTTTNWAYYRSRMEHIKAAVERLHRRGKGPSPVFLKSANTWVQRRTDILLASCNTYEFDQIMRDLFIGLPNVTIIDAWGMTLSHRTGYGLHPLNLVKREEIKMLLNFLC